LKADTPAFYDSHMPQLNGAVDIVIGVITLTSEMTEMVCSFSYKLSDRQAITRDEHF
jgi:hypothetical protein